MVKLKRHQLLAGALFGTPYMNFRVARTTPPLVIKKPSVVFTKPPARLIRSGSLEKRNIGKEMKSTIAEMIEQPEQKMNANVAVAGDTMGEVVFALADSFVLLFNPVEGGADV
jgi:hypothetical protein